MRARIIKVVSEKYAAGEHTLRKSCSESSQQIYLCKILCSCVITELKVLPGDKTTHAVTEDGKHNTALPSGTPSVQTHAEIYINALTAKASMI